MKPTDISNPGYFHKVVDWQWGCPAQFWVYITRFLACLALWAPGWAGATVSNPNPNVIISIIGEQTFNIGGPNVATPGFAVKLTNAQGVPLAGLVVEFLVDKPLCAPLLPCNLPPSSLYGKFGANNRDFISITTDVEGIARSGPYQGGTSPGSYRVEAMLLCLNGPQNCAALSGGGTPTQFSGTPSARFVLNQNFASIPPGALLDGHLSGNWYDPSRNGQGLQLEFTEQNNTLVAIWFTYAPSGGGQQWIYAQGPYQSGVNTVTLSASISSSAGSTTSFPLNNVTFSPWGTMTITFSGCNDASLNWSSTISGYGSGSMLLKRLTSIKGTRCPL